MGKIFFKILFFVLLFSTFLSVKADVNYNYDTDYISSMYELQPGFSGSIIDKVPWYNFIITKLDFNNNCIEINCLNALYNLDLYDYTWSLSNTGTDWKYTLNSKNDSDIKNDVNIFFNKNLYAINNSSEYILYIRLEGYFLKENSTKNDYYNSIYSFITDDRLRIIKTIIILNLFMIFLFLKTIRLWFRIWNNYFINRKKDD